MPVKRRKNLAETARGSYYKEERLEEFLDRKGAFYNVNDIHIEDIVLYWIQYKNSLKYKIGCLWRFSHVYTIN